MRFSAIFNKVFDRYNVNFQEPSLNNDCSELEVNNWVISRFVVNRLAAIVGVHPFPVNEQMLMVAAVCYLKPSHIFEWGTNIGKSARIFFETCKAFGVNAEIHTVELPDGVAHQEHPKEKKGLFIKNVKKIKRHLGDGLETSLRIIAQLKPDSIKPLFFVDGDHSYESVVRELEGIIKAVPQSNILVHDTFYQSEKSGYNIGPYKALADVLAHMPNKYKIISQNLGLPGMVLLWQKD